MQVRADTVLRGQMWADAEHELTEAAGKVWTVAAVHTDGRWTPAAWAAAQVRGGVLVCSDNYERRGPGRTWGLYREVYAHRHRAIVQTSGLPAVTHLFRQPIALHEADGWQRTGAHGPGEVAGHEWWELRRD